jgi:glutathione synthase
MVGGSITVTLNRHGAQSLMVQKFLPKITLGDKPVPFCLARIAQGSEVRGNLAARFIDALEAALRAA